jgi:pantetheine-phosphate adenylyltransferase
LIGGTVVGSVSNANKLAGNKPASSGLATIEARAYILRGNQVLPEKRPCCCPDFASELELRPAIAMQNVTAIYPGSFDPVTNGHLDLISRGARIFGRLIVAVLRNAEKAPLFSLDERVEMLKEATSAWRDNVEVDVFDGLLMDYARRRKALVIVRGIRAISDYEYELQMALMNRKLEPGIETMFMMPAEAYSYLSSRLVREIAQLGGAVKDLVPAAVEDRLRTKFR